MVDTGKNEMVDPAFGAGHGRYRFAIGLAAVILSAALVLGGCALPWAQNVTGESGADETSGSGGLTEADDETDSAVGANDRDGATGADGQEISGQDGTAGGADAAGRSIKSVTISATGDCAIGRVQVHGYAGSFEDYFDRNGADYFLEKVRPVFADDDFTLVNCEGVLTNETERVEKEYSIKGYPEYAAIFAGSSVEGATLGNNHSADYGPQSLIDTEEALTGAGIAYAINDHVGTYETADGIRIGFVSVSMLGDFPTRSAYMEQGLTSLRDQVDILIACPHMGIERENVANDNQRNFAHQCIDWGADLVIGNHPHVLQGMEVYQGKVIVYSLGNFCFGANHNPSDYDTVIFQQTFTFVDDVLRKHIEARVIPCSVSSEVGNNNYQPMIYSAGEDIARVIGNLNDFSTGFGEMYIDSDGYLVTE